VHFWRKNAKGCRLRFFPGSAAIATHDAGGKSRETDRLKGVRATPTFIKNHSRCFALGLSEILLFFRRASIPLWGRNKNDTRLANLKSNF